ncbi:MAG: Ubiquinone biosynthesis O-methyltransferase [Gammaproteobacteria bacterium]|nr:Ubiquinone biosynthesis O-methyltransferase [Gammaproteobacteria bacterium]
MKYGIRFVEDLLRIVGPGSFLLLGCDHPELPQELLRRACSVRIIPGDDPALDHDFAGSVSNALPGAEEKFHVVMACQSMMETIANPEESFAAMRQWIGRYLVLAPTRRLDGGTKSRMRLLSAYWADAALRSGLRRAPAAVSVGGYPALNNPALQPLSVFEVIGEADAAGREMQWLLANRDLHMDMSREFGPRSDAHMVRYAQAAEWVRPGDTVLDCACGLGYGSAILAARSAAGRVIGVDIDPASVSYAQRHFAARYGIEFMASSGTDLAAIPDRSIDLIASFETIEHVEDYHALIAEFARVLKPDGRIVASVPNLWVDETGRDPNPHHFHAFDWEKFRAAFDSRFIVEARYRQEAPGGFKLQKAARALERCALDTREPDTEWWILVASMDPTAAQAAYSGHPQFARSHIDGEHVADFGAHYQNPWIYRSMVQMGERIADDAALADLALRVLQTMPLDSVDAGAAITVLGYHLLARRRFDQVADWRNVAEAYLACSSGNPHVLRWQISTAFAAALLARDLGLRDQARADFDRVATMDALAFSPLLMTKIIAARFWSGVARLVDGDPGGARACFHAGTEAARAALHAPDVNAIGSPEQPLGFGFQELAEVADMASQCATAMNCIDLYARSPGLFWSRVDTRRFGLASWAKYLEQENRALQAHLTALVSAARQHAEAPAAAREAPGQPCYKRTA